MSSAADFLLLRDRLHLDGAPAWMESVIATGIGAKIAGGRATGELALHLVVDDKLPLRVLSDAARIPARIDGLTTDLVRARGEFSWKLVSGGAETGAAEAVAVKTAFGAPVMAGAEAGTIACAGRRADGSEVLLTCAHVAAAGQDANLRVQGRPRIGSCGDSVEFAQVGQFYAGDPKLASLRACTDAAAIALDAPVVFAGGLPGRIPFSVGETGALATWLLAGGVAAQTFGSASGKRKGQVIHVWPRVNGEDFVGFCSIQQERDSLPADSGSLWLGYGADHGWVGLGLHRGMPSEWPSRNAFVTDLRAGMSVLGVTTLLTDPDQTTTVSLDERVLAAPWLDSFARRLRLF